MKRLPLAALLFLLFALAGIAPAAAQVIVPCPVPPPCLEDVCPMPMPCPVPPVGGVFTDPEWLRVDYHRVTVDIENQIANTHVDMKFVNEGQAMAEGTFLFPLPQGAAVDQLTMWVNGTPIEARILGAEEARGIYNEIVRQFRDPALLEFVGSSAIQANIFPIPPGEERRIEIAYSQILEADNGLIHYVYPMNSTGRRSIGDLSLSVNVVSNDEISNIYSPSHNIALSRSDDNRSFRAGFEATNIVPDGDFSLYYSVASETINVNLITYRESAAENGFFMLLVQPPVTIPEEQVVPKDVIIVLDQSGSMFGEKWDQARQAAQYVLEQLNSEDRFNVILFSTGWRIFSNSLESPGVAQEAIDWIHSQEAIGGTDIHGALTTALGMVDAERPTTILFMTDGVATEGVVETEQVLGDLEELGRPNVRIFTFGVGDDVDTLLLDSIVRDHGGASSYVRPSERIDEEVASLYNKVSAPVLTDISLDFGSMQVEELYPVEPLPDLFAGTQLTLIGRYRGTATDVTITLRGKVGSEERAFLYSNLDFPERAGGDPFVARLWATRRIGDLLNNIRLNGENQELVDSIVRLSVRYGIITPYTSFLIEENDILTQAGRERAAQEFRDEEAQGLAAPAVGSGAVDAAESINRAVDANAPMPAASPMALPTGTPAGQNAAGGLPATEPGGYMPGNIIQTVNDKTFLLQDGVWMDTAFEPDTMETQKVTFLSDEYFALLDSLPQLADYFALGDRVIVLVEGVAYEVVLE